MTESPPSAGAAGGALAASVGTAPGPAARFCRGCGAALVATASICPTCGTDPYENPKSKTVAIMLAVLFGAWTWAYTWRRDSRKFWLVLAANAGLFALAVATGSEGVATAWGLFWAAVWLWAVIGAARRPLGFYERYPDYEG